MEYLVKQPDSNAQYQLLFMDVNKHVKRRKEEKDKTK